MNVNRLYFTFITNMSYSGVLKLPSGMIGCFEQVRVDLEIENTIPFVMQVNKACKILGIECVEDNLRTKVQTVIDMLYGGEKNISLEASTSIQPEVPPKTSEEQELFVLFSDVVVSVIHETKAILINDNGTKKLTGEIDGTRLRQLIGCEAFQRVPCTVGDYAGKFDIWCDENFYWGKVNTLATRILGEQVNGGVIRGKVVVVVSGFININ